MTVKFNLHRQKTILLSLLLTYLSMNYIYPQSSTMFLYETEKGYTYVDKDFNPLMNKYFKWAGRFFEGLAVASENGYVGYINTNGNFIIGPEFEYALPFHYGVAKVWKDGKPYLIDKNGEILFEHNYSFIKYAIKDSFEPVFLVTTQGSPQRKGIIDKNGKFLIDTIYDDIQPFCDGLAVIRKGNEVGVVNLQGEIVVPFGKFSRIGDYNSSRAAVTSNEWDYKTIGFIDDKGNIVFKKEKVDGAYYLPAFSNGLIVLRNSENNRYVLMDTQGNKIYDDKNYITLLEYGYAAVYDTLVYPIVKYNVIDKFGREVYLGANNIIKQNDEFFYFDGTKIKNKLGFEIKKENVFIKNNGYYSEDYFIHNDLIIRGEKRGIYMNWSSTHRYNTPYNENDFMFIDPSGFKDGLLYVIFYDNSFSNLSWGYINEKGEIIYRNRNIEYFEKAIKLNVNYMEERGLFYCIDENNNDLKLSINPNEITLLLDSSVYEKSFDQWRFPPKKMCHSFKIINETLDTLLMKGYMHEQIFVQAKDKNGVWRNIQTYIPTDVITDEIHKLEPNKFWEFAIQSYSGGFKTKMRVVIKALVKSKRDESEEENIVITTEEGNTIVLQRLIPFGEEKKFISNEIDCEINASQFVRNQFTKDETEGYPFEDYEFDRIRSIP